MLKRNELVNGRYVNKGIINFTFIEDGILGAYIRQNRFDSSLGIFYPLSEIEGIPIIEEWLLKFGFKWKNHGLRKDNFVLRKEGTHFAMYLSNEANPLRLELLYIHQLQNLYFALIGEELKIKE